MDKRALFFLVAGIVCGVLIPLTPVEYRWFAVTLTAVYFVLAVASYFDHRSRSATSADD